MLCHEILHVLASLAPGLVPLQSLLGAEGLATLVTVVDKTVWEVAAFDVVPHIGLGHMSELVANGARVAGPRTIERDVFVEIFRFGNVA